MGSEDVPEIWEVFGISRADMDRIIKILDEKTQKVRYKYEVIKWIYSTFEGGERDFAFYVFGMMVGINGG